MIGFYPVFIPTLIAYCCALLAKSLIYSWQNKKLTFNTILKDGGMPSAHTALVVGLTTSLFWTYGDIPAFWVSAVFSLVVIRDAFGVRFETGKQAIAINALIRSVTSHSKMHIKEVKAILGHTPLQVLGGIILSVTIVSLIHLIFI